jgi:hypothetical protein
MRLGRDQWIEAEAQRFGLPAITVSDGSELAGKPELAEARKWL